MQATAFWKNIMSKHCIAMLLAASLSAAQAQEVAIPENWAAAPRNDEELIRRAVRASIVEENELAIARAKAAAIPVRYTASSEPDRDKYERFGDMFDDAKVPGCLQSDALKRQPTFIFGGLLALPFIAVAAVRGKCN
ncbi:MAG TPA: hypothetical protein VGC21_20575 [Telluria sp.]